MIITTSNDLKKKNKKKFGCTPLRCSRHSLFGGYLEVKFEY